MQTLGLIIVLLASSVGNCIADEPGIASGLWTGTLKLPGQDKATTRVQVRSEPGADAQPKTRITMYVDETPLEFIDLDIRKNTLHFNIDTGTVKRCTMKMVDDGAYKGFCEEADAKDAQGRIEISMRPPKENQISPAIPTEKGNE